jgi:hypothetical protein
MRRQVGLEVALTSTHDTYNVVLASRLVAAGGPPPAVPVEDPEPHATMSGVWSRELVRPAGLVTPTAEYVGRGINIVRL